MSNEPLTRFDVSMTSGFEISNGISDCYQTPIHKKPQAEYENLYGYPADIDKVWAHRNECQQ